MLNIKRVIQLMKVSISASLDCDWSDDIKATSTTSSLFDKIQNRFENRSEKCLRSGKALTFDRLTFIRSYEIGAKTGNQLLQILVGILNDSLLCQAGNAIVFSIEEEYIAAIVVYKVNFIEFYTITLSNKEDRFLFSRLCDDDIVRENVGDPNLGSLYTEERIKSLRINAKKTFPNFLKFKTKESKSSVHPFFFAFFGILFQIALVHRKKQGHPFNSIPVAACVMIAMTHNIKHCGKLKQVFGKSFLPPYSIEEKAANRLDGAEVIIKSSLQNEHGQFKEEDVKNLVEQVKRFYQL